MRQAGRITEWNDAKGFGFVTPHDGGARAFVHIKAFQASSRRPVEGELISYDTASDAKGRLNAASVRFAGQRVVTPAPAAKVKRPTHPRMPPRRTPRLAMGASFLLAAVMTFSARAAHSDDVSEARLLAAACHEWDRLPNDCARRRWVTQELVPILVWSHTLGGTRPVAPPRASWKWYARQAAGNRWQDVMQDLDARYPGEPDRSHDHEGMRYTRLGSRSALFRAGLAFRNCLTGVPFDYYDAVSPGAYYWLSDAQTGRPLALLLAEEGHAGRPDVLLELRGPCNQPVSRELLDRVQRYIVSARAPRQNCMRDGGAADSSLARTASSARTWAEIE